MNPFQRLTIVGAIGLVMIGGIAMRPASAQSSIPSFFNYQGRLTSPVGVPVADGTYSVTFRLFKEEHLGTELWKQTTNVTTKNGIFSTVIGQGGTMSPTLFKSRLWLEIEVEGRLLKPRQELGAVAFAITAMNMPDGTITTAMIGTKVVTEEKMANNSVSTRTLRDGTVTTPKLADGAVTEAKLASGIIVPVGAVIAWWGNSAAPPSGWSVCDGSTINDSKSPLNGMKAPDLRQRFVRGAMGDVRTTPQEGGADTINLSHNHRVDAHRHGIPTDLNVGTLSSVTHDHGDGTQTERGVGTGHFAGSSFLVMSEGSQHQSKQALGHNHGGLTTEDSPSTNSSLPTDQPVVPRYFGLVYLIRIR